MADVFISYARKRRDSTELLASELEGAGFSVWWDQYLEAGVWREEIGRELKAAAAVIVIWTKESIASEWVKKEAAYALRKRKLLNLYLPDIDLEDDNLFGFNDYQFIPFSERSRLFRKINEFRESSSESGIIARINAAETGQALTALSVEHPNKLNRIRARASNLGLWGVWIGGKDEKKISWVPPGQMFQDLNYTPRMRILPAGQFMMGAPRNEPSSRDDERPVHKVTISKPFAVGVVPVMSGEWAAARIRGFQAREIARPSSTVATRITWNDAINYTTWLSSVTGSHYRLLSESEWEYACRGRTGSTYSTGPALDKFVAVFNEKYLPIERVADSGPPDVYRNARVNEFGLYDMHGLVWEWVQDDYHFSYYGAPDDGSAWQDQPRSEYKVIRGGCYASGPRHLRSARRTRCHMSPNEPWKIGFRVGRDI